jgi:hypothetical protein
MKSIRWLPLLAALAAFTPGVARAVPSLQLYFDPTLNPGAYYDTTESGWVTSGNPATISAFMQGLSTGDTFRMIISLPGASTDPNGTITLSVSESVVEGSLTSSSTWFYGDAGLAPHGVFDTWYTYVDFTYVAPDNAATIFDVQTGTGSVSGYRDDFTFSFSGVGSDTTYHFDLVDLTTGVHQNGNYIEFAPFSHDAERVPGDPPPETSVPEPMTVSLFAAGLLTLAASRRKSKPE